MQADNRIGFIAGIFTFILTAYLSLVIFDDYPFSADEYSYWYQAHIFALGKMSLPIAPRLTPLGEIYTIIKDGQIFSKYSPGFSAVLTLAVWLGVSGWVNPLLSTLTIMVMYATVRRIVPAAPAIAVTFLIAFNSYFLGYGGSYFSQPLALFLTACGFYGFERYESQFRRQALILGGTAIACGFLVRPLDAFCLWLALVSGLAIMAYRRKTGKGDIAAFCAVSFTGLVLLFIYNYWTVQCFCIAKYPVWDWQFKVVDPHAKSTWESIVNVAGTYRNSLIEYTWVNFTDHFIMILGLPFLSLALIGVCTRRDKLTFVCSLYIVTLVALYTFHPRNGWPQYGSRYWYPTLAPLAILAAYGAEYLSRHVSRQRLLALFVVAMMWQGYRLNADIKEYTARFAGAQALRDDVNRQCPAPSIVIVEFEKIRVPGGLPHFVKLWDLKRNPFLNGDHLFVYDFHGAQQVQSFYPNYALCRYVPSIGKK